MPRRRRLAPITAFLLAVAAAACRRAEPPPRPPVVLLTVDTLRADHLGLYGERDPTSPHLDALAADAVVFDAATSTYPATVPSLASLLTGTYPATHGIWTNTQTSLFTGTTLATILRAQGYRTVARVANPIADVLDGGFDDFAVPPALDRTSPAMFAGDVLVREAARLLDALPDDGRPLFLWLHLMDPHGPYWPPEAYRTRFDVAARRWPGDPQTLPVSKTDYGTGVIPRYQAIPGHADPAEYRARYDGEIRAVDDHVGAIVALLRQHGLWERAIVVVTADHGESLGEHGYFFQHGQSAAYELSHVPLLLRAPGRLPVGRRVAASVSLVDVVPTILDLLGVAAPPEVEGRSLLPVVAGKETDGDAWTCAPREVGLRRGRLGYRAATDAAGPPKPTLFDLVSDPAEQHDLAAERPDDLAALAARTTSWLAAQQERRTRQARAAAALLLARERAKLGAGGPPTTASPAREDALRALGYVQ